jgi:hypothetical protein
MTSLAPSDWGEASEIYDQINSQIGHQELQEANEAQTRFDVIDRIISELLGWRHGQVEVEVPDHGERLGYVDYILRAGDRTILVEAKKIGAAFPSPTKRAKLKLAGSILSRGEIGGAIRQAETYAIHKEADIVVVTNGLCWCFYSLKDRDADSYASLLFPFSSVSHAERLFLLFSASGVARGSLDEITNHLPPVEHRLSATIRLASARVDRNSIADYIAPALDTALYADALLSSPEHLERCFVSTEARTRFDKTLGIHLADPKPEAVTPAKRIRKDRSGSYLDQVVAGSAPSYAPPVTLIIGQVGVGKSTYLKHFELVSGKRTLDQRRAHWIYIDFEQMGEQGNPRKFIYQSLLDYLQSDRPTSPTDYKHAVEPAYAQEIAALARGPLAPIQGQRELFNQKISEHIARDFDEVEPYVDKVLRYLARDHLCIIVLDNIDLYENDALETTVFSEGLALSKRLFCHVIVSIRDTTFVRHRTDSTFDAYELRKLWLDPPPFSEVVSTRLTYSKRILAGKAAKIPIANGMHLVVPDLSMFFDVVQQSILAGPAGAFIDYVADQNIRRGLNLVTNFLTSGHIQADRALQWYIAGQNYRFPFHEVFKGTMLGQWRQFREDRSEAVNLFDARLGARRVRLLRLHLLSYLLRRAQSEATQEVPLDECIQLFSRYGANSEMIIRCLSVLHKRGLVRNVSGEDFGDHSTIVATRSGGYYVKILSRRFPYVEACLHDTAIDDKDAWQTISELTESIEAEQSVAKRMEMRYQRLLRFLEYLCELEHEAIGLLGEKELACLPDIRTSAMSEASEAVDKSRRHYQSLPVA